MAYLRVDCDFSAMPHLAAVLCCHAVLRAFCACASCSGSLNLLLLPPPRPRSLFARSEELEAETWTPNGTSPADGTEASADETEVLAEAVPTWATRSARDLTRRTWTQWRVGRVR